MEIKPQSFLDRPVRRRWFLYTSLLLIFACVVIYVSNAWGMHVLRDNARSAVKDQIKLRAETVARTIAITSRQDVLNANYKDLQTYLSDVVGQRDISYIAIVTPDGVAVVHTNAKYKGEKLTGEPNAKADATQQPIVQDIESDKMYDAAVPVMGFTQKAAVVRVGVSYASVDGMFTDK